MPSRRAFLTTTGTAGLVAVAGCASDDDGRDDYPEGVRFDAGWRSACHDDANTCFAPDAAPVTEPSVAWRSERVVPGGPTVGDGVAVVPTTDGVRAVATDGGTERWTAAADLRRPPTILDGVVLLPADDGPALRAVEAATGAERWRVPLPGDPATPPAVSNDRSRLFVGLERPVGGAVCCVDVAERSVAWTRETRTAVGAALACNLYSVLVPTVAGELYRFGLNGGVGWRANLRSGRVHPPVVGDERLYVAGYDGSVTALDRETGRERWRRQTAGVLDSGVAFDGERVYVGQGDLTALDAGDGRERWSVSVSGGVRCLPAVAGETVYVGTTEGAVVAVDAAGGGLLSSRTRWSLDVGSTAGPWLAATDGRVYATALGGPAGDGPTELVAVEG
jgi:outer membrane protein assembly factor BamB